MKIGIDARLFGKSGIGRYLKNLIDELEKIDNSNDYIIFVDKEGNESYHPKNPRFKKWLVSAPPFSFEEQTTLLLEFARSRVDVLHVPNFNVPLLYRGRIVVTIHDYTMSKKNLEATTQSSIMYEIKFKAQKLVLGSAVKKAKRIIVPSNVVKDETIGRYSVDANKIAVTYEAVEDRIRLLAPKDDKVVRLALEKFRINNNYFLYVGTAYPHKNLKTLVVSQKENWAKEVTKSQIVLAGKNDLFYQRLAGFVNGLKLNNQIVFATKYVEKNNITDEVLALLYRGALAYVSPALNEGFSLSPLEAQSIGVPLLLSDIPVHREIYGDSALYFDPNSTLDLSDKLLQMERDINLRNDLITKGLENVKKYSWTKMAQETLKVYNEAVQS
ncbi:MAG: glycosyltransferase family 1 protein [Thermosphaera sp.]